MGNMDRRDFCAQVNDTSPQDGFKRDWALDPLNFRNLLGKVLDDTTTANGGLSAPETNQLAVVWGAGTHTAIHRAQTTIVIPGDYYQGTYDASDTYPADQCSVIVYARMGGTTDSPTCGVLAYKKRGSTALGSDLGSTFTVSGTALTAYEVDLSGNDLRPGDALAIGFYPGTHTTDAIFVYGVTFRYRTVLALFDEAAR